MLYQTSKVLLLATVFFATMIDSTARSQEQNLRAVKRDLQGHGIIIQNLIDNRHNIHRTVDQGNDGVIHTKTWSDQEQVTDWIQEHVAQMLERVENNQQVRPWDPLFVALFENKDSILTNVTNMANGVSVALAGITYCGRSLVELHAQVVSTFIDEGRAEVRKSHAVPAICSTVEGDLEIPEKEQEEIGGAAETTSGEETTGGSDTTNGEGSGGDQDIAVGEKSVGDSDVSLPEESGGVPDTTPGKDDVNSLLDGSSASMTMSVVVPLFVFVFAMVV